MRRLISKDRGGGAEVDISPLIDVVFILLIFFMVSTTFVKDSKLDIERPGAQSASSAPSKAIRISIDRTGAIFMDNVPVRPWMVQSRVREGMASANTETVLIITDRRVLAETLIDVVDQARLAGAADVGVVTNAETGEGS
ncbi:MAG: biopolymer transport protein ExbD [Myxococcota bacterium]|jgi:biopolymer transport protein ExbD